MNISKEAIEAAAEAAINEADTMGVTDVSDSGIAVIARVALEAAAPMLMAQAWDEGELAGYENAKVEEWPLVAPNENPYRPSKEQS